MNDDAPPPPGRGPSASTASQRPEEITLARLRPGQDLGLGYVLTRVSTGKFVELTLAKGGGSFRVWLRPVGDDVPCYRQTAELKIGYEGQLPDRDALRLVDALCELAARDAAQILDSARVAVLPVDAAILADAAFSSIYDEWLPARERQLDARAERVRAGCACTILLVNATKGLQFYPSIVDFFALLQRAHTGVRATGASYFDVREFQDGVAAKGLDVASIAEVMMWETTQINRFDVILFIGPSAAMARIMALPGVTAKLVLLDLGFYHQLIETNPDVFLKRENVTWRKLRWRTARLRRRSPQVNPVVAYSCQPEDKIALDLANGGCALRFAEWRWFNYIPIGFTYCRDTYCRSSRQAFDVALLGTSGRDYGQIDPALWRGKRFLFLGKMEEAPALERCRTQLNITAVSRVNQDTYTRLLALCRCVVLPLQPNGKNVLLSVVDAIAAGKPLVTPRHEGLARLERDNVPVVFYDGSPLDLARCVDALLRDGTRRQEIEARSIAFAKESMDIYRLLWTIFDEQVL